MFRDSFQCSWPYRVHDELLCTLSNFNNNSHRACTRAPWCDVYLLCMSCIYVQSLAEMQLVIQVLSGFDYAIREQFNINIIQCCIHVTYNCTYFFYSRLFAFFLVLIITKRFKLKIASLKCIRSGGIMFFFVGMPSYCCIQFYHLWLIGLIALNGKRIDRN